VVASALVRPAKGGLGGHEEGGLLFEDGGG
jgi:hypothetical protein